MDSAATTHDLVWAAVVTGSLAFIGVLLTAFITWRKQGDAKATAKQVADEVLAYLDTGNGNTAGQALTKTREMVVALTDRTDRIEVRLEEHLQNVMQEVAEGRVLRDWVVEQMEKKEP